VKKSQDFHFKDEILVIFYLLVDPIVFSLGSKMEIQKKDEYGSPEEDSVPLIDMDANTLLG
jgi:hypothetical protein